METSVVTIKGQVVIPTKIRKKAGIKKGTRVFVEEKNGAIIIHPATPAFYAKTFGILKGGGLVKSLEKFRKSEKEQERRKVERR